MRLYQKHAIIVKNALKQWRDESLITDKNYQTMLSTIEVEPFDFKRLAFYSFIVSIFLIAFSIFILLIDETLLRSIKNHFSSPFLAKAIGLFILSLIFYGGGAQLRHKNPEMIWRNEGVFLMGVCLSIGAVSFFSYPYTVVGKGLSWMLLSVSIVHGIGGILIRSISMWGVSIVVFVAAIESYISYLSGGFGHYFLGMNLHLQVALLGGAVTFFSSYVLKNSRCDWLYKPSFVIGLFYVFIGAWLLSIFGNYDGDTLALIADGQKIPVSFFNKYRLMLFTILSFAAITHGHKTNNHITRAYGLVFLGINIYTRYFEFCWFYLSTSVFIALLGISFWMIGIYIERIWKFRP